MTPTFILLQQRVTDSYAAETGAEPNAIPPGTIGGIISVLLPILLQLFGQCKGTGSPPSTGAKAFVDHCQNGGTVFAHFRIRRQIQLNGGLEPGMQMRPTVNAIIRTGAMSTPDEINQLVAESSTQED